MIDLTNFFTFVQFLFHCIPLQIMSLLGVLAMFSVFGAFHNKFGGDSH